MASEITELTERLEAVEEKLDELLDLARTTGLRSNVDHYDSDDHREDWEPGGVYY